MSEIQVEKRKKVFAFLSFIFVVKVVSKIALLQLNENIEYHKMIELPVLPCWNNSLLEPENKLAYKNYMRLKFEHQERTRVHHPHAASEETKFKEAAEEEEIFATFGMERQSEMMEIREEVLSRLLEEAEEQNEEKN